MFKYLSTFTYYVNSVNKNEKITEREIFNQELKIVKKVNPQLYELFSMENHWGQSQKILNIRKKLFMLNLEFAIFQDNLLLMELLKKDYEKVGNNFKTIFVKCEKKLLTRRDPENELKAQIHLSEIAIGDFNLTN